MARRYMPTARRYDPRVPRTVVREQRAIIGMRDSSDPTTGQPRYCRLLRNLYPLRSELGEGLEGRPGYYGLGDAASGRVQCLYQFTDATTGTERTLRVAGGALAEFDWGTETWSAVTLGGGATLDATAPVACVTFQGQVIFSDGVNTPFMWDGVTTFTVLTNCPVLYGQPGVYYGKLIGIKAAERNVLVWSEEGDATTGYEAGGYNNAWQMAQTAEEPIVALDPYEQHMVIARARSTTAIFGAVSSEFTSTGTREAVHRAIGVGAPFALVSTEYGTVFLDADGHPQVYRPGAGISEDPPLWLDCAETAESVSLATLSAARAAAWPQLGLVLLAVPLDGASENNTLLVFDALSGAFAGVWDGGATFEPVALATVKDGNGVPTVVFGTSDGQVYAFGQRDGSTWSDAGATGDGEEAIVHELHGAPLGYDLHVDKWMDRLDLAFRLRSDLTGVTIGYITPRDELLVAVTITDRDASSGARWDVAEWDVDEWVALALERKEAVGLGVTARWLIPVIRHDTLDERFGVLGWALMLQPRDAAPGVA